MELAIFINTIAMIVAVVILMVFIKTWQASLVVLSIYLTVVGLLYILVYKD